jgi:hypothetical protein
MPKTILIVWLGLLFLAQSSYGENIVFKDTSGLALNFPHAMTLISHKLKIAQALENTPPIQFHANDLTDFIKDAILEFTDMQGFKTAPQLPNVTQSCLIQLYQLSAAITRKDPWAMQVLDAFAKPPSGIFQGIIFKVMSSHC